MKKKVYFIIVSILQIIIALYTIATASSLIQTQIDTIPEVYAEFGVEYQERMRTMFENGGEIIVGILSIIAIIMNALILKEVKNNNILKKKGKLIALSGICFFTASYSIASVLAIINVIILVFAKRKNPEDYPEKIKKEIPPVEYQKSTKKELIFGAIIILTYFGLPFLIAFLASIFSVDMILAEIAFDLIMLILVLLCFKDKLKRDLKLFKENGKAYFRYVLPKIGIMYVIYFIGAIISASLSKQGTSVNQEALETLPKWFLVPIAIIWAPIVEELIFRGVLRRFIKNNKLFIVISGVIFGLIHTIGEATLANVIIMAIPYAIIGGGWAYLYAKTDNITNNILAHSFQNTIATLFSLLVM
jgi:membrane protease YdiL (CAAX protease family)